jgi:DNA primase catalytic core
MPRIPEDEIERIKATVDLAALVRSRGVELKKHGSKDLIGRCPFHEEASASFVVTPHKRIFHCLGCGAAGNVIQFVERFDGVSFRHAFELLAAGSGFAAPARERPVHKSAVPRLAAPVNFAAEDAALIRQVIDYYHERLMSAATGAPARAYLKQRGLDNEGLLRRYKIGFADRSLGLTLPPSQRRDGADIRARLTKLGIYRESGHEHFNGCVIVPITDADGNITEVYGRRLDDGGKSGIKHLYLPGPHVGMFNAGALNEPEVILCEAVFDALTFLAAGIANVSTIYGTEGFTDELFNELKRRKVQRVKLAYDADDAGERAATRDAARLRAVGIEVYRVKFPWGMDANEYARKVTPSAQSLRLLINSAAWLGAGVPPATKATATASPSATAAASPAAQASPVPSPPLASSKNGVAPHVAPAPSSSLAASLATDAHDEAAKMGSGFKLIECGEFQTFAIDGREYRLAGLAKNNGVEALKLTLRVRCGERLHSDQLDLCRDLDRRRFVDRAAEECAITADAVKRDLSRLLLACEQWQEARLVRAAQADSVDGATVMTPEEEAAALALLRAPELLTRFDEAMQLCGLVGERVNGRAAYLACTSRKLAKPLAVIVQSTSAAGKSTLMDAALSFFPEDERIKYSAMTGQSLYYLGDANLKHKILAIVEEEGAEKASYALKLLQSEGELTIASTGKDPNTGRMETQEYHVEGPVMIFLTTTTIDIDDELLNRCLVLSVDESAEQTARIHERQRKARTLEGLLEREARKDVLALWRNAQRLIKPLGVVNPFAGALTFTSERTRTRRDHEKYLTLIDSIALLHQHQREVKTREVSGRAVEFIEVQIEDIETANALAPEILGRSLDELPPQTRRLLNHIRELVKATMADKQLGQGSALFSRREVCERCGWSYAQVRTHIERLIDVELVATRAGRSGAVMLYELLMDANATDAAWQIGLIDTAKLKAAHNYDANLEGQNGNLDPPCESGPSSRAA